MPCTSSTMYAWNMEARSRFEVTPPTPTHTCAGICHPVPLLEGAAGMNSLICALVNPYNTEIRGLLATGTRFVGDPFFHHEWSD